MSFAPLALIKIGGAISAASTVLSAVQAGQQASFQSKVAANNAAIAEQNAKRALENSQSEAQDYGAEARQQIAAAMAETAASGVQLGTGSAFVRSKQLSALARRDAERIAEEGRTRAEGFRQQGADFQASAMRPKGSFLAGALDFGTSLIGTATAVKKYKGLIT